MSKQVLTSLFCLWFAFANTFATVANAQSSSSDFEAPIIEHEEIASGVLGDIEVFAATVVDNEELEYVSLFYRYAGDSEFIEVPMQPLVESSYYSASVNTGARSGTATAIEYYIRAADTAGNVVLKGLSFDPLERTLVDPNAATNDAAIAATDPVTAAEPAAPKKVNWLYVGLGVLLLGGIAAAAGGGDDDVGGIVPPTPLPGCEPTCTVTLTLSPP